MPAPCVRLPAVAATLLLAGCGTPMVTTPGCTAPATAGAPPPSATAGQLTATADTGLVAPGAMVELSVTVSGPAHLMAPCSGPLELVVVDRSGLHVFAEAPEAAKGLPCGDVTVDSGHTTVFLVTWTPDDTLPSGTYSAVLTLGNSAPLTLPITLAHRALESCAAG